MKLIEDLGMQEYNDRGNKAHLGLYECPICSKSIKCKLRDVERGHSTKCRQCGHTIRSRKAALEFTTIASSIHNDKYDYSLVNYTHGNIEVEIICPEHGVFSQTPKSHKGGNGCPRCSSNARGTTTSFIEKACKVHGDKYDYTLVNYTNYNTKVEIICPIHGSFWQIPSNHIQGKGCTACNSFGFDSSKSATLYYLKITYEEQIVYKIGITNRTVKERFNNSDLEKIQILKTWDFPLGKDAYDKEQRILKLHSEYKYVGAPILSSGNTELFTIDVLGLDY